MILYSVPILGSLFCFLEAKITLCFSLSGRTLVQGDIPLPKVQPSLGLVSYLQERPIPMRTCQPHHHKLCLKEVSLGPSLNCNARV